MRITIMTTRPISMSKLHAILRLKYSAKLSHREIAELETGLCLESTKGVPQGGALSPLLSNILLDELDKKLTYKHLKFARYADDIIILVKTKSEGLIIQREITAFITK